MVAFDAVHHCMTDKVMGEDPLECCCFASSTDALDKEDLGQRDLIIILIIVITESEVERQHLYLCVSAYWLRHVPENNNISYTIHDSNNIQEDYKYVKVT